jgi:predicted Zn-dependent protease
MSEPFVVDPSLRKYEVKSFISTIFITAVGAAVAWSVWSSAGATIAKLGFSGPAPNRPASTATTKASAKRSQLDDPYSNYRGIKYSNEGLVSERDESRLGARLHSEVLKKFKLSTVGQTRLNQIGQKVAAVSQRPKLAYRFYVVTNREINAFSGPGGYIYVTSGLMKLANDDELAAVLAHEIGHVVARHSLKSLQNSESVNSLADWFGSITGVAGKTAEELGKAAANMVGNGFLTIHSRDEEREADYLGVHDAKKAGYDPNGMIGMFKKLQELSKEDSSLLGSLFSDHPDLEERIENTRYEIDRIKREGR